MTEFTFPPHTAAHTAAPVSTRSDALVSVVAVIGDPRDLRAAEAFTADVPARQVRVCEGHAWVHTDAGTIYGVVLACPGGDARGQDVAAFDAWVIGVDPRADTAADTARGLTESGFHPCDPPLVPVPVPPRWIETTVITDTGWYHGFVWQMNTPTPLETLPSIDTHGHVLPLVPLEVHPGTTPTRLRMLALWDPHADPATREHLTQSLSWHPVPTPADATLEAHIPVLRNAARVLRVETAHLLGAPVVTGVHLPHPDALTAVPGWEAHLPGDIVDEIVEALWAANRDDLLPGG